MPVRATTEVAAGELERIVAHLSSDPRGNALILADLLALPDLCDVHVLESGRAWTVAASRRDLPFKALAFSAGCDREYRDLIRSFSGRFRPRDLIYSLMPQTQTDALASAVEIESADREIQLFKDLAPDILPPTGLEAFAAKGLTFRVLGPHDLDSIREIMKTGEAYAFAEASFQRGLYWGAFDGERMVCVAGTHSLARHAAEIGNVFTLPQYRRRGLARTCLSLLLRDLSGHTKSAFLSFFAELDFLRRLYVPLGFGEPRCFDMVTWRYP